MTDLETRLQRHAESWLAAAPPVTIDEVKRRAGDEPDLGRTGGPPAAVVRWLGLAAVLLVLVGLVAVTTVGGKDEIVRAGDVAGGPLSLDGHRDWVLGVLNGEIEATDGALAARYSDGFRDAVPPATFRKTHEPLLAVAPWRVVQEIERRGDDVLGVQIQAADGTQARLTLHRQADGRLDASTILRAVDCAPLVDKGTPLDAVLATQLDWVMELLAGDDTPSADELERHFAPSFLQAVPVQRLRELLPQVRDLRPFTLRHYEGQPGPRTLTARLGVRSGEEARLTLTIEPDAPHRITGFAVFTQQPCRISP
jgi:hypothetical protein